MRALFNFALFALAAACAGPQRPPLSPYGRMNFLQDVGVSITSAPEWRGSFCNRIVDFWDSEQLQFRNRSAARDYAASCLRLASASADARRSAEQKAAAMVGVLAAGVVRPPCHAVLLNDRQIVTAAHCFVSRNGTETPLGAAFRSRDLVFIPNGGPRALVAYDPLRQMPWKTFVDGRQKRADDFAILELATPAAPALAIDGYARVLGLGDRLFSPAYWLEAGAGDTLYADRWDDLCRVAAATDKCFVHTCTTMPGISGAPVFKIETNAAGDPTGPIFLAGIHNGAAKISREEEGRACGPELTDPTAGSLQDFNVGVTAARVCQSGSADRQSGVCSAAAGSFN